MSPRISPPMPSFILNSHRIRSIAPLFAPLPAKSLLWGGRVTVARAVTRDKPYNMAPFGSLHNPAELQVIASLFFGLLYRFVILQGPPANHKSPQ